MEITKDWKLKVDLIKKLIFPTVITSAQQRPCAVLWSPSKKSVIIIEFTVPRETTAQEDHERAKFEQPEAD